MPLVLAAVVDDLQSSTPGGETPDWTLPSGSSRGSSSDGVSIVDDSSIVGSSVNGALKGSQFNGLLSECSTGLSSSISSKGQSSVSSRRLGPEPCAPFQTMKSLITSLPTNFPWG